MDETYRRWRKLSSEEENWWWPVQLTLEGGEKTVVCRSGEFIKLFGTRGCNPPCFNANFRVILGCCHHLIEEENHKREPIRNVFQPLHIALALTRTNPEASLSFSILDVLLLAYRHQFHDRDEHGRLPLHYAAASYEYSTMPWNENDMEEDRVRLPVKVWNRLPTGWSEMVRREDDKLRTGAPVKKRNSVIQVLLKHDPQGAGVSDKCGFLPLHFAIESEKIWTKNSQRLPRDRKIHKSAARDNRDTNNKVCHKISWAENITTLLEAHPEALERRDPKYHLYPFMQAAVGMDSSIDTVYRLLRMSPALVVSGSAT